MSLKSRTRRKRRTRQPSVQRPAGQLVAKTNVKADKCLHRLRLQNPLRPQKSAVM